jgi:hypothetical protein
MAVWLGAVPRWMLTYQNQTVALFVFERSTLMITYPIVLKSHPQRDDVLHRFELVEGSAEGNGFELISTWLKLPGSTNTTDECTACGAVLELPDGSLEAHLKRYQAEHGGKDAIVRAVHRHKGPVPSTRPPGWTFSTSTDRTRSKSIKEFIQMRESSSQAPGSDVP